VTDAIQQTERALLGSILEDNLLWTQTELLSADDFSISSHRTIYRRMAAMFEDQQPVDTFTLINALDQSKQLTAIGDVGYISQVFTERGLSPNFPAYVRQIRQGAQERKLQLLQERLLNTTDHALRREVVKQMENLLDGATTPPKKNLLLTPSQLRERERISGANEQLVEGLLPKRGVNVAVGDSNIGKSPLVVQVAVCVAAGIPFLGCETKQGKVVLVDYENTGLLSDMIEQTTKAVGADPAVVEQNLTIVDRDEYQTLDELIALTKDAALVVVDSFRFLTNGDDSNGKVVMPILKKLNDQKNCWLLVHHVRKDKADAKKEEDTAPLVKADSVIHWLECASGHRSIINQTTNRWAICDREIRTDLLLRVAAKGKAESAPLYLTRKFEGETPIGYTRATGFDFLTEGQQEQFQRLVGMTLNFDEMARILGTDKKPNKSSASRLLNACRANKLVESQFDGKYRFVASK
jgi:hypothetical protein